MMSIISKLNECGISVIQTEDIFCGYKNTEHGATKNCNKNEYDKKVYFLEIKKEGKEAATVPCRYFNIHTKTPTGEIFTFNAIDLYAEYFNFNEDKNLESYFKYGYSKRTRDYIEVVMNNIGLVKYTDVSNSSMTEEGEPTEFKHPSTYKDIFVNADTEIGEIEDNMWVAQTISQYTIDDFAVIKMYFNHKPNEKEIRTAFSVKKVESEVIPEVFTCYECGEEKNWLDVDGDIEQKYQLAKENYCGSC